MTKEELKRNIFVGVIEDNEDPKRLGRCKVRVLNVFNEIPVEDIPWAKPWKDLSGNVFSIPEKGKVVSVVFDGGSIYKPEFIYAEHYNINLENKLQELSQSDYPSFKSIMLDQTTQIFRTKSKGLVIDHEYSNINIDDKGNINVNLKNNGAYLKLGTFDADQQAVLGNHFMDWMDKLVDTLGATPYIGNLMVPVFPSPTLLPILAEYRIGRATSKYLSKNVKIVDNTAVNTQEREYKNQDGDQWKSTVEKNTITQTQPSTPNRNADEPQTPEQQQQDAQTTGTQSQNPDPNYTGKVFMDRSIDPSTYTGVFRNETTNNPIRAQLVKNYQNGKLDYKRVLRLVPLIQKDNPDGCSDKDKDHCWYLWPAAADGLEKMMQAYEAAQFPGKTKIFVIDAYRSYDRQVNLYGRRNNNSGGNLAAKAGTSPHGWGFAIDLYWGIDTNIANDETLKKAAYKHPVYQWLHNNGYKYGWYNPEPLRDGGGEKEEWWHWEYMPQRNKRKPGTIVEGYRPPFTQEDWQALYNNPACKVSYMKNIAKPIKLA